MTTSLDGHAATAGSSSALRGADVPPDDPSPSRRRAGADAHGAAARADARAAPQSLAAQLRWIRVHWAGWLDDARPAQSSTRSSGSSTRSSARPGCATADAAPADGSRPTALAGRFGRSTDEPEAFSEDRDWMAELVLVAKSTYVWLAQLSRAYGRAIERLDQVPDEELDELRARASRASGSSASGSAAKPRATHQADARQPRGHGLGLLGRRLPASPTSSAASPPGATCATALRHAASASRPTWCPTTWASTSSWVVEHPERFISSPLSAVREPTPSRATDLSAGRARRHPDRGPLLGFVRRRGRLQAHRPGQRRDALHLPRQRRHELPLERHRPAGLLCSRGARGRHRADPRGRAALPGHPLRRRDGPRAAPHPAPLVPAARATRPGIPSRCAGGAARRRAAGAHARRVLARGRRPRRRRGARHAAAGRGVLAAWRATSSAPWACTASTTAPSCTCCAMRRTPSTRQVIRETVAFDARILGRYVNFMNNPDERSAVDQFGSHDKYFGVATLLATLPGLPMFGHGQVEGYSEQYGMEFRRPQRDETPERGPRRAASARDLPAAPPALAVRGLARASGSSRPRDGGGEVPDVFAYANRARRVPVAPRSAARSSSTSIATRVPHVRIAGRRPRPSGSAATRMASSSCTTSARGLDYLRQLRDLRERRARARRSTATRCFVFLGFEVVDAGPGWVELARRIGLEGVADAHEARRRLLDEPIREAVEALFRDPLVAAVVTPEWATPTPADRRGRDRRGPRRGADTARQGLRIGRAGRAGRRVPRRRSRATRHRTTRARVRGGGRVARVRCRRRGGDRRRP